MSYHEDSEVPRWSRVVDWVWWLREVDDYEAGSIYSWDEYFLDYVEEGV